MNAFSTEDRQAGYTAMEKRLTRMQKAYRKFLSGKPPASPKNTPLGAVVLATEQRKRLADLLNKEKVKGARITSMGVVIRFVPAVPDTPADFILVEEGKESQAIASLEQYGAKFKRDFVIAGLLFAVQDGKEKRPFAYPIERTPEGEGAVIWSYERQMQRKPHKDAN
jgi:hypothetical protein